MKTNVIRYGKAYVIKIMFLALILVALAFTLISCSENDDNKFAHTVTHVSDDYETAGKYVFEQGQVSTVSFFVGFDPDMPDSVVDEGLAVKFKAGDTIISQFNVAHTAAEMGTGITIEVPIPTDTLGTTDYHILLLSKYGVGCGSSAHETRFDFAVEVIEPTDDGGSTGTDGGTQSTDNSDSASQSDDSSSQSDDSSSQSDDSSSQSDDSSSQSEGDDSTGSAQSGFAITRQPVDTSVAVGASLILSVEASGSGTLSYQWYTNLTNSYTGGIALTGKNSPSASINTTYPFVQYYYCVITQSGTGRTLTTNIVTASAVGDAPTPTPEPTPTPTPTSYGIWVAGIEVTPANADDILDDGSGGISYNAAENTLYITHSLDTADYPTTQTGDLVKDAAIGANRDLIIHADFPGANAEIIIDNRGRTAYTAAAHGVYINGNLTVMSDNEQLGNSLKIFSANNGSDGAHVTGNLTVNFTGASGIGLRVNGGDGSAAYKNDGGYGIYVGGELNGINGLIDGNGGASAESPLGSDPSEYYTGGIGIYAGTHVKVENSYSCEIQGRGGLGDRGHGGDGIHSRRIDTPFPGLIEGYGGLGVLGGTNGTTIVILP